MFCRSLFTKGNFKFGESKFEKKGLRLSRLHSLYYNTTFLKLMICMAPRRSKKIVVKEIKINIDQSGSIKHIEGSNFLRCEFFMIKFWLFQVLFNFGYERTRF